MPAVPPPIDWDAFPHYWAALLATQDTAAPWPSPQQIHLLPQVASTNQTLWQYLAQGAPIGTTVIAQEQTAGRGQWGRRWTSATGGLYLSWSCAPDLPIEWVAQLTLCSAWGIATALRQWGIPVAIKWPNDLVLLGRKLGGILTETRLRGDTIQQAVVGVGINWVNPVPEVGINLRSFWAEQAWAEQIAFAKGKHPSHEGPGEQGGPGEHERQTPWELPPIGPEQSIGEQPIVSIAHLAAIVLQGVITGYGYWQQAGIAKLLSAYEALLCQHYQTVQFQGQAMTIVGITPEGALRVRESGAERDGAEHILQPGQVRLGYGGPG